MKKYKMVMMASIVSLAACYGNQSAKNKTAQSDPEVIIEKPGIKMPASIKEIISSYLQLKNAFTNDNSNDAVIAGRSLAQAFKNFDTNTLDTMHRKAIEDISASAGEEIEHIIAKGGNIEHQRMHFQMLSEDMYDLVKSLGAGRKLYKDYCPMYNKGKGAFWISEIKEIKNPYLGKAMPDCGSIQEEIK